MFLSLHDYIRTEGTEEIVKRGQTIGLLLVAEPRALPQALPPGWYPLCGFALAILGFCPGCLNYEPETLTCPFTFPVN